MGVNLAINSRMKFIHDTVSVCNECYRHIPGVVFERDDQIWLTKKMPMPIKKILPIKSI